jgi:ATP-dependent DNA helicase DinG
MEKTLPQPLKQKVRDAYTGLMRISGGARRRGQQVMIGAIANAVANAKTIDGEGHGARLLAVNAPPGAGKSYAYGLGAIPVALANGLKVVIATGKVSLQEQLIERDLVELQKVIPDMKAALVKGRNRFGCSVRIAQAVESGGDVGAKASELMKALADKSWSGDVDDLKEHPGSGVWSKFNNDSKGCSGRKCGDYATCPYYQSRIAIQGANVLVTNHSMLLADLKAGNVILPRPQDMVLVIDEAHGLPKKAIESLADGHTLEDAQQFVQKCGSLIGGVRRADRSGACGKLAGAVGDALEVMSGTLSEARMAIGSMDSASECRDVKRPVRFKGGKLPEWLAEVAKAARSASEEAGSCLKALMESLQGEDGDGMPDKVRERLLTEVGQACGRVEQIASVWGLMTEVSNGDGPIAKWIELVPNAEGGREMKVCASPVGVGAYLHEVLWSKVASSIHLSGTLTTVGGMAPYLRESGLDRTEGVKCISVESPFDYELQGQLIVPKGVVNPKDAEGHTQWLIEWLPAMIERNGAGEGILVLFTSFKQMREVAEGVPAWASVLMLRQDQLSRREILERHETAIKAGVKSVIMASATFEEGVDLRGSLCTMVVLAKLQFQVPNDPVAEELKEYMESQGRSFFVEVAVPDACRRLAQSSGRLIRTETDHGCVVVADPRLVEQAYGRGMMATLPPYRFGRSLA